jgi:hypothetical protein
VTGAPSLVIDANHSGQERRGGDRQAWLCNNTKPLFLTQYRGRYTWNSSNILDVLWWIGHILVGMGVVAGVFLPRRNYTEATGAQRVDRADLGSALRRDREHRLYQVAHMTAAGL